MRLLVLGGSGYLGSELLRRSDAIAPSSAELDIRSEDAVRGAFGSARPDAVINTAYRADERATTCDGAIHVARAAAAAGARLVHMSTDVVFDGEKGSPYVEDDPPAPLSGYGRDKADAERGVLAACPGAAIVRTSLIYGGPEPGPQERLAADPEATFFSDEIRSPVHVGDLAQALLELAAGDHAGLIHVAGAEALSRHRFAELLSGGPVRAGTLAGSGLVRPRDCSLSLERATALLATRLRGARELLERP